MNTAQHIISIFRLLILFALMIVGGSRVHAEYRLLYSFGGAPNGGVEPIGQLVNIGGKLFGTTVSGGIEDYGLTYSINTDGTGFTPLHLFQPTEGVDPANGLTRVGDKLLGVTYYGGGVFSHNLDGSGFEVLHRFTEGVSDGIYPYSRLNIVSQRLVGTTYRGGARNAGVIYSMDFDGQNYSILHHFNGGPNGRQPRSGVTAVNGWLLGTTQSDGQFGAGTIYSLRADGSDYRVVHHFGASQEDGRNPLEEDFVRIGTRLYGTTWEGGDTGFGTIYSLNSDGSDYSVLYSFQRDDGRNPSSELAVVDGKLYGTTHNNRTTLWTYDPSSATFSVLHRFNFNSNDGPNGGLVAVGRTLYGTSVGGGTYDKGTLFSFTIPIPEPNAFFILGTGAFVLIAYNRYRRAGE